MLSPLFVIDSSVINNVKRKWRNRILFLSFYLDESIFINVLVIDPSFIMELSWRHSFEDKNTCKIYKTISVFMIHWFDSLLQ